MFHSSLIINFFEYLAGFLIGIVLTFYLIKIRPDWKKIKYYPPPINKNIIVITTEGDTLVDRYMYFPRTGELEFFFNGKGSNVFQWSDIPY
jgi:hypothetical protein